MMLLKKIILFIQAAFNRPELHLFNSNLSSEPEPVFIIGAPRTGSTMLFQLLIVKYKMFYISNLMALFPMFMSTIASIFQSKIVAYNEIKKSNFGVLSGLHAPNEAAKVNDMWFSTQKKGKIRLTVGKITSNSDLLIKAMNNSLKIQSVLAVFPNAKFIYIKRDLFFNAQSLLMARRKLFNDLNKWWSLKPDGYLNVVDKLTPHEQVVWQINTINATIEKDLQVHNANFIQVNYEDICAHPAEVLKKIGKKFNLEVKNESLDLSAVSLSDKVSLSKRDEQLLLKAIKKSRLYND